MNVAECQSILSAGYTLGGYRVERFLGQGGFGVTYLAHDIMLDVPVAIKEYLPEKLAARTPDGLVMPRSAQAKQEFKQGLDGFIKEARTLARFKHPNIVRIMGVFELNGTAYIVMEYENGQDLKAMLGQAGQISQAKLEQIIGPILDGLEEVHRHGFIHRDIKPANIRIRNDGTPVLLDFGAARHQTQNHAGAMTALVSVGFAPMEQYTNKPGSQKQGPWTDIYALGAVLYYAVTGHAPVDSAVRGSALLNDKPDPLIPLTQEAPKGYTPAFCRAIDWAMRFKVSQRPQSLAQWRPRLLQEQLNAGGSVPVYLADRKQKPQQNGTALYRNELPTRLKSESDTASDSFLDLIDKQLAATETPDHDGSPALQKTRRPNLAAPAAAPAAAVENSGLKPDQSVSDDVLSKTINFAPADAQTSSSDTTTIIAPGVKHVGREAPQRAGNQQSDTRRAEARDSEPPEKQAPKDVSWEKEPWEQETWEKEPWEDVPWGKQQAATKHWESDTWEIGDITERNHRQASAGMPASVSEKTAEPPWLRKTAAAITGALLVAIVVFFSLPALIPGDSEEVIPPAADWVVSSVDTLSLVEQPSVPVNNTAADERAVAVSDEDRVVASANATGPVTNEAVTNEAVPAEAVTNDTVNNEEQSLEVDRTVQAAEALRQRELERQRWFGEDGPTAAVENDGIVVALNEAAVTPLQARDSGAAMVDSQISDRDMAEVLRKFDALSLAIRERDIDAVRELTMPSQRIYVYLEYLFSTFETIEVSVSDIRGSRSLQRITGTIRIREMVRPDGERVPPPSEFEEVNVYSVRSGDWSKIHW